MKLNIFGIVNERFFSIWKYVDSINYCPVEIAAILTVYRLIDTVHDFLYLSDINSRGVQCPMLFWISYSFYYCRNSRPTSKEVIPREDFSELPQCDPYMLLCTIHILSSKSHEFVNTASTDWSIPAFINSLLELLNIIWSRNPKLILSLILSIWTNTHIDIQSTIMYLRNM